MVSIGFERIAIKLLILPSYDEGAEIHHYIDGDSDGVVSVDEANGFAREVLAGAKVSLNGQPLLLREPRIKVPSAEHASSGTGVIQIEADALVSMSHIEEHTVVFEIQYDKLSDGWFVQPFYDFELNRNYLSKNFARDAAGHRVHVLLASPRIRQQ